MDKNNSYKFVYEYNDRGRGPHLEELIRLNNSGIIKKLQISGYNYFKDTVNEVFSLDKNIATWKSSSENGSEKTEGKSYFVGVNSTFANTELLIKKLLSIPDKSIVLLPGLFDNHTHLGRPDGILCIAGGVTSVRDMRNSLDFPTIKSEFDKNITIGPRVLIMCGLIDKAGPYTAPIGKIVTSLNEALSAIDFYKQNGYNQIKLYSLTAKAHALNLRIGGHIPAYMLAGQAILNGCDEFSHVNMIVLNFLSDTIDTRTPLRFSMVGKYAQGIDLKGIEFKAFIKLLKDKNIVVDPTVSIFEGVLTTRPGNPDPILEPVIDRLPLQVSRAYCSGSFPIPEGMDEQYKASWNKLLQIVYELYINGITILPGTDDMSGFVLHKELENYVKAGIPPSEVLRIATILSARVIGVEDKLGSIEEGKLADMILVDGNPVKNISDIRRVELTIKDGNIYNSADLYAAVGVKYFK
jgi:hypothetical protein